LLYFTTSDQFFRYLMVGVKENVRFAFGKLN